MAVLAGRVAVVTGASTGIGAGLAALLAAEGAQVVMAARRAAGLEQVAKGIRRDGGTAIPVVTDLTDDDSLANLLARTRAEVGPVDVLVNVPGANPRNFLQVDEVVDVVRFLLHTGDNVKLGPEILVRTMRNPMTS